MYVKPSLQVSFLFIVFSAFECIRALNFNHVIVSNQAAVAPGFHFLAVRDPFPAPLCRALTYRNADVWDCGPVNTVAFCPGGPRYNAPQGQLTPGDVCLFHTPVGNSMILECGQSFSKTTQNFTFTLAGRATCEDSTCGTESAATETRLANLESRISALSAMVGDGLSYSITLEFCSASDKSAFDSLKANIVMTKAVDSNGEEFTPVAWQSLEQREVLMSNSISWTERYDLLANNQIVSDNVRVQSSSKLPNANLNSLYTLKNGLFTSYPSSCQVQNSFCVQNMQGITLNIGLSQDSSKGESILGVFPVGNSGQINMTPKVAVTVFLGHWQKNAFVTAFTSYPETVVTLSSASPSQTLTFDSSNNQFTTATCPT